MDSLQKCAKAFDQLTRYQYHFVIGRKGQTLKFTVSFDPSDFHHLAGLHKLKDNVRLQTGQRSTIFRDVLDGKYPFEQIKHSAYFSEMEQRLTPLAHLVDFLDSNEIIFRYNEKANRFSAIQADYLLLNDVKEIPVYVFLAQRTGQETYVCRTLFPKTGKDYTVGQPKYTLLQKEKCNLITGETIVQYDRLSQKSSTDFLIILAPLRKCRNSLEYQAFPAFCVSEDTPHIMAYRSLIWRSKVVKP